MPAVSVIIPVYQVEPYMARCAHSLFGQTLKDMEFIFIDDCTPDRSMAIMQEVLEEYPERKAQVRVFQMPHNSGQAKVRMQGIALATGDYVIHCDSDDEVDTDAYRQMYEKAIADKLDIVSCNFERVFPDGKKRVISQVSNPGQELSDVLYYRVWGSLWCRLIRRPLLTGIVPPEGNLCEDVVITCQAICNARHFGYVPEALYHYYVRESSAMFSYHSDAVRNGILANANILMRVLRDKYHYSDKTPSIVYYKYFNRSYLMPKVHIPAYYNKWRNIFPEIDRYFLFVPGISLDTKFWFVLIHLHLYHPWKRVSTAIRKWFSHLSKNAYACS